MGRRAALLVAPTRRESAVGIPGQRRDFHHKTALWLLRRFEVIYLEDLRVSNLLRNHPLAKSISDAGWAQFRGILEARAAYAGRKVVAVPAHYTSQDCSGCGEHVPKSLSVRTHICRTCGQRLRGVVA